MTDRELVKDIVGYINTVLRIILFIPQLYHVFSMKDASGMSTIFLCVAIVLSIDTFIYGYLLEEIPLIIASCGAFLSVSSMLIAKMVWKNREKKEVQNDVKL